MISTSADKFIAFKTYKKMPKASSYGGSKMRSYGSSKMMSMGSSMKKSKGMSMGGGGGGMFSAIASSFSKGKQSAP